VGLIVFVVASPRRRWSSAQGQLDACASGVQVRVRDGQVISFGSRWLTVLRRSSLG